MKDITEAYYRYDTASEYLCETLVADLRSFPSVGPEAAALALKITFLVHGRLIDGKTLDEPEGRQTVTWVTYTGDLKPMGEQPAQFVKDAGVHLARDRAPKVERGRFLLCAFGSPDHLFRFQPVTRWHVVDPAAFQRRPSAQARRSAPFDLDWEGVTRTAKRPNTEAVEFGARLQPWSVFERLVHRHPHRYPTDHLGHDVWNPGGDRRNDPERAVVYTTIRLVNQIIRPLELRVKGERTLGYLLEEAPG